LDFSIEDEALGALGIVTEVLQSGPTRLLQFHYQEKKEVLIPVNAPFITSVNKSKKLIKVSLPDGFLDI
jgi:16S rRNA processing protein RimM